MKKKIGYTLAEVLIALGIIGFISAIMLPMINKVKPDPVKVSYIKTYDGLMSATHDIVSNTIAYPLQDDETNPTKKYNKCPLFNTAKVKINGKEYGGDASKFCQLLGTTINTIDSTLNCSKDPITYTESIFDNPSFTGTNGAQYVVSTDMSSTKYQSDIYVDVNGKEGKNCFSETSGCKNPDRFKFTVAANGMLVPQDKVGAKYLEERMDWTKRAVQKTATTPDIAGKVIANLQPESLDNGWYQVCGKNFTINGLPLSCSEEKISSRPPFLEVQVDIPFKYDMFYTAHLGPNDGFSDIWWNALMVCRLPAGETSVKCGVDDIFWSNSTDNTNLTKENLYMNAYHSNSTYTDRSATSLAYFQIADEEIVRTDASAWPCGKDTFIENMKMMGQKNENGVWDNSSTVYKNSLELLYNSLRLHVYDYDLTQENAPELYDAIQNAINKYPYNN